MAYIGIDASLEYESGSSWVPVPKCKSVSFPGFNISSVDTNNLDNSNFGMTYMPGCVDAGSCAFECEYSTATYTALQGLIRDVIGWRITAPDGHPETCDGFLTKLDVAMSPNEEVMITGEIKFTGIPS